MGDKPIFLKQKGVGCGGEDRDPPAVEIKHNKHAVPHSDPENLTFYQLSCTPRISQFQLLF